MESGFVGSRGEKPVGRGFFFSFYAEDSCTLLGGTMFALRSSAGFQSKRTQGKFFQGLKEVEGRTWVLKSQSAIQRRGVQHLNK